MPEQETGLSRTLGLGGATALGLGAMIGAGIFVLVGLAAAEAGPSLILAFALNGLIALIVGACYAELVSMEPRDGGIYVWAKPAFGPFLGFSAGWMSWFAQAVASALYASAFGSFLVELISSTSGVAVAGAPVLRALSSTGLLALLLAVNLRGARETGQLEVIVTGLKVGILVVVVAAGFVAVAGQTDPLERYTPFMPEGFLGLLGAMGLTFIAFEGYEVIVQTAEEVEAPEYTIPRAIFLSIFVAVTLYVLVAIMLFGAVHVPDGTPVHRFLGQFGELGIMEVAGQVLPYGKQVLLVAGLASTASALNATIFSSTRIAYALGRGGDLPPIFASIHPRHRTPHRAIQISGTIMLIGTLVLPIKDIAAAADLMFLLVFVLVCATVIRLRRRWPDRDRPFRVAWVPGLPLVGILAGVTLSLGLLRISLVAWVTWAVWMGFGCFVHVVSRRARGAGPI